jgi:eukaryotic-like serine/threonine-protein kinase
LADSGNLYNGWGTSIEIVQRRLKRRRLIILGCVLVLVLVGVILGLYNFTDVLYKPDKNIFSNPAPGDWPMFQRDPAHSGSLDTTGFVPQGNASVLLKAGSEIRSTAAISNGILYVGSRDGKLYALDILGGKKLWDFQTVSWVDTSPAVVNGVVYFGSNDGNLYALDARSGKLVWKFSAVFPVKSSPAVADGKVYFGTDDNMVYALDAETGKKAWAASTGDYVQASPVVADGLVFAGSWDGYMYALDARSGRLHLKFVSTRAVTTSAVVSDGIVYFTNNLGTLLAMDGRARNWPLENWARPNWDVLFLYGVLPRPPATSGYLWQLDLKGGSNSSPTLAGGDLYVGAGSKLCAVDLQSHTQLWATVLGGTVSSTSVVIGNFAYVGCQDGKLYVLNLATGEVIKAITLGGSLFASPVVVNGTIYVGSTDGNFYAVK